MSTMIPDADALVSYIKDFTGSSNDTEIKQCIFLAEMQMRNIELPALRTNPYETFGTVGANQLMPIPADMNKPILFFKQGQQYLTTAQGTADSGSTTLTLSTVPNQSLQVGMLVYGVNIPSGTTIVSFPGPDYDVITLSDATTGAVINGVSIKALPTPTRARILQIPLFCYDKETDKTGNIIGYEGYAKDRLNALESVEAKGETIIIAEKWIGPSEAVIGNKKYKVRLDL